MLGSVIETTRSIFGKSIGRAGYLMVLSVGTGLGLTSFAQGQVAFTTASDWTNTGNGAWTTNSGSTAVGPSALFDFDGQTTNGIGNAAGPGGSSTGASLQITPNAGSLGQYLAFDSYNIAVLPSWMSAWDPGGIAAYSAASSYGAGSTVAYSGTIYLVYTQPTFAPSTESYFQVLLDFDYAAAGYYQVPGSSSDVYDGLVDGQPTYTETIPYTVTAGSGNLSNLSLGLVANVNSGAVATSDIYVDDISFSPPVQAVVPEPATLGILGVGLSLLTMRRRSQA